MQRLNRSAQSKRSLGKSHQKKKLWASIGKDQISLTIELVCSLISQEMHQRNLTCTKTPYLESHAEELVKKSDRMLNQHLEELPVTEDSLLLASVIRTEWDFFDQVENEGGSRLPG